MFLIITRSANKHQRGDVDRDNTSDRAVYCDMTELVMFCCLAFYLSSLAASLNLCVNIYSDDTNVWKQVQYIHPSNSLIGLYVFVTPFITRV